MCVQSSKFQVDSCKSVWIYRAESDFLQHLHPPIPQSKIYAPSSIAIWLDRRQVFVLCFMLIALEAFWVIICIQSDLFAPSDLEVQDHSSKPMYMVIHVST